VSWRYSRGEDISFAFGNDLRTLSESRFARVRVGAFRPFFFQSQLRPSFIYDLSDALPFPVMDVSHLRLCFFLVVMFLEAPSSHFDFSPGGAQSRESFRLVSFLLFPPFFTSSWVFYGEYFLSFPVTVHGRNWFMSCSAVFYTMTALVVGHNFLSSLLCCATFLDTQILSVDHFHSLPSARQYVISRHGFTSGRFPAHWGRLSF